MCVACVPCNAGEYRSGCGGLSSGDCISCAAGKYKRSPGAWNTACDDCGSCPGSKTRLECGGDDGGVCVKEYFYPGNRKYGKWRNYEDRRYYGGGFLQIPSSDDVSAETMGTQSLPLDGLHVRYRAQDWDAVNQKWVEWTKKHAVPLDFVTISGTPQVASGMQGGATKVVTFLQGGVADSLELDAQNVPEDFTICTLTRYTGSSNTNRIVNGKNKNWMHGIFGYALKKCVCVCVW